MLRNHRLFDESKTFFLTFYILHTIKIHIQPRNIYGYNLPPIDVSPR